MDVWIKHLFSTEYGPVLCLGCNIVCRQGPLSNNKQGTREKRDALRPAHLLTGVAGEASGKVDAIVAADGQSLPDAQPKCAPQAAHKHACTCPHTHVRGPNHDSTSDFPSTVQRRPSAVRCCEDALYRFTLQIPAGDRHRVASCAPCQARHVDYPCCILPCGLTKIFTCTEQDSRLLSAHIDWQSQRDSFCPGLGRGRCIRGPSLAHALCGSIEFCPHQTSSTPPVSCQEQAHRVTVICMQRVPFILGLLPRTTVANPCSLSSDLEDGGMHATCTWAVRARSRPQIAHN